MISQGTADNSIPGAASLPLPKRGDRWQPLRSGVLNLYRYDYEEFHFEDGRLLLRGNNGSGKSRVLALQLPFLIDGEVSPARVEPDGDPAKRIEWNLLMGKYPDRTGYTWIEFGRRADDGTLQFLTLGCGLRAVAGHSGLHSRWFFVTPQRIGRDLFLQTAQHMPLGKDKLEAALGSEGRLILKVEDYKRAVDEALFGLGPRFGPLVELLLRLRRPQLSRKLDEEELSNALSDALPTLPTAIIDEVAESFSSLQTDRGKLREFAAASQAVTAFLGEYSGYMRMAVRRRSNAVRTTHAAYEAAQRAVRDAERRFAAAEAELESLRRQQAELEQQQAGADAVERTLRESPEMKTADEIRLAGDAAMFAGKAHDQALSDESRAEASAQRAQANLQRAEEQAIAIQTELQEKLRAADAAALVADLASAHREQVGPAEVSTADFKFESGSETSLRRTLVQRERAISVLRAHEQKVADAQAAFETADAARLRAESDASAAREAEHAAREALDASSATLLTNYTAWQGRVRQLRAPEPDQIEESFAAWVQQRGGQSPLRGAIEEAQRESVVRFVRREGEIQQLQRRVEIEIAGLDADIERLTLGETTPPPAPSLPRADRMGRAGAPLWRLCDFRPALEVDARAGLEAALQASGLLDAWVLPDGRVLGEANDIFLIKADVNTPAPARHLGEALMVAIDRENPATRDFDAAVIERILASIGLGEGAGIHWVATSGGWQLGPLTGRAGKTSADYIGESTRAEHRRRQLTEIRLRRLVAAEKQAQLVRDLATLTDDRARATREFSDAPQDEPVLRAGFALEAATRSVADTSQLSERAGRIAAERRRDRDDAAAARDRDANDLHLIAWLGRLDALAQATSAYTAALAGLWPTARHWTTVAEQLAGMRSQASEVQGELQQRRQRREEAAVTAEAARQRFATLQEMHGEGVAVVLRKLKEAEEEVARLKRALAENQRQQLAETTAHTKAQSDKSSAEQQRVEHEASRRSAIGILQRLAEQRLLAEADPALRELQADEWSVAHAVELARHKIDALLADVADDDVTWQRRQDAIHGHIQDLRDRLIAHGHQPEPHQVEDLVVVQCVFQARPHTMTELRDAFAAEISERERLLQAKEQEIIENHLLAEAAVELTKLIRAAEIWRSSANQELNDRPTSAGVRFRFQWEPDAEIRFNDVRPVLLRKGELWTPSERTALAAFLQARIAAE